MQIKAAFQGSLQEVMARETSVVFTGTREAIAKQTYATKQAVRALLNAAFTGSKVLKGGNRRVANTIRGKIYDEDPEGKGRPSPFGIVYSNFGKRVDGRFVDYLLPHALGMTVTPTHARKLFIPLTRSRNRNARALRPDFNSPEIQLVPAGRGVWLVVRKRVGSKRQKGTPIGLLVDRVKIPKRFTLDGLVAAIPDQLAESVVREMATADRDLRYERYQMNPGQQRRGRRGVSV